MELLNDDKRAAIRKAFAVATPYRHLAVCPAVDDALLRGVHNEMRDNLQATLKETDLFKLFQTIDLGNLSDDDMRKLNLHNMLRLRTQLYSPEFRAAVEDATGCGKLSDRIDCAANVYATGHHLLTHDDVIGTRRVSYILYMGEPDYDWQPDDGGALELYGAEEDGALPSSTPVATLLPKWNSMAMFLVEPGVSYHSVQEVYSDSRLRLSLQGWFHYEEGDEPDAMRRRDLATVRQLTERLREDSRLRSPEGDFLVLPAVPSNDDDDDDDDNDAEGDEDPPVMTLSDDDLAFLRPYVNEEYLTGSEDIIRKMRTHFLDTGSVQLCKFLRDEVASAISFACRKIDERDRVGGGHRPPYDIGQSADWLLQTPPHLRRFLRLSDEVAESAAGTPGGPAVPTAVKGAGNEDALVKTVMARLYSHLMRTRPFANLLERLTTLRSDAARGSIRRFRAGLDYTVAHYGALVEEPRLDATLCFVDDSSTASAEEAWQSGECGGYQCYMPSEDDTQEVYASAEVYKGGDEDEDDGVEPPLNVPASDNTLNIVLRHEGYMRFVKYVASTAPGSRWDVMVEYKLADE